MEEEENIDNGENFDNEENREAEGIISESDLLDVYDFQYNDLFSKILKINEEKFFALLQEQVLLNLRIINKLSDLSLMSYFQDLIAERYKTDKRKIEKDLEIVKKLPENEIKYLDYSNCYIHCHKNLEACHKCSNKLILYEGFIYCLHCNKVYNEKQIKLYCMDCDEIYYSRLRENVNETNKKFLSVVFTKNHCPLYNDEEEKIKCLECGEDLYCDVSEIKENKYKYKYNKKFDSLKEIVCKDCKLLFDTREIKFTCSECGEEFMSDAKLYIDFPVYKKKILYLIHTLRKDKLAQPLNMNWKKCKCDINLIKEYYHDEDNGILLEGHKDDKNKVVCDQCFYIFNNEEFEWKCPLCRDKLESENNLEDYNIPENRGRSKSTKYKKVEMNNKIEEEHNINEIKNNIENNNDNKIINYKDDNKNDEIGNKNDIKEEIKKEIIRNNSKNDIKKEILRNNSKNDIQKEILKNNNKNDIQKEILRNNSKNDIKKEILRNNSKNDIKKDNKDEENKINIDNKKYKNNQQYNNLIDSNKAIKLENNPEEKNDNKNKKSSENNNNNQDLNNNQINVINYFNKDNNYKNYQQKNSNNNNKQNYIIEHLDSHRRNNQNKEEEIKNKKEKELKEINNYISSKYVVQRKNINTSNNNNNNQHSSINVNRRNCDIQKRSDYINNRKDTKNIIRRNHQIININDTSKRIKRNSTTVNENSKKEIKDNKEKKEKQKKIIREEFNNLKKYFEDCNEEFERNIEARNKQKLLKIKEKKEREEKEREEREKEEKEKKEKEREKEKEKNKEKEKKEKDYNSNKNLRIQINVDNKNAHLRNNISNVHNYKNINNVIYISNKNINDNKNYQNTDSNINICHNYKRPSNCSRDNIREKKDMKKNLSGNRMIKNNDSSNKYNVNNIKVNKYNKENNDNNDDKQYNIQNNDNNNNNNERKKYNIQINDKKDKSNKNEQQKNIYKKSDDINKNRSDINNKKEEPNKNEKKEDDNNKEVENNKDTSNYSKITINSNNYKNIRILGQGSYGKIYLVEDLKTKEQYAMKKLILGDKLELRDNQDEYNMIMQITTSYPELNIIHVYGTETKNFDEYNFVFYVLMEVANCDWEKELLNRAKHKAYYTEDEIFYILQNLVDTFAYLQQIGICHRDIKPQNILCFGEKGYKISDFGEAKYRKKWRLQQISVNYTSMQTVRGTELYMSPILYTALKTSPNSGANHNVFKSDVFSLGMCFLFASCLDYKSLYEIRKVNNMKKLSEVVDRFVNGKYSKNFTDLLLNMLQLNEKERPDFIELSSMV
jgi:hypothetical protein